MSFEEKKSDNSSVQETCHICGESGHFRRDCPQKQDKKTCHVCGEEGHFRRDCPQKQDNTESTNDKPDYYKRYRPALSSEDEEKLKRALIRAFPQKLSNDKETLHIYIDGYNIIGCDRKCRDFMYKTKEKQKARQRMAELVQCLFFEKAKFEYGIAVHLWFDGHIDKEYTNENKCTEMYKNIEITHTPIEYVVDDKLVDELAKIGKAENGDKLVITSDRELVIRLYECGVFCMKSGTFYKEFLKEN